jgi:hypothetical protein
MANEYVTTAELKATLSMTGETYADDDIALALEAASRTVDAHCRRRFYPDANAAQVRYYTPWSSGYVPIDDLIELTTLKSDPGGDGTYENTWVLNTDFTLQPTNAGAEGVPYTSLQMHPSGSYVFSTDYPRTVQVTGKFGWASAPPAVKQATSILAARLMKRAREAPFAVAGFSLDGSVVRVTRIDPDVEMLLAPFVKRGVPFR